MFKHLKNNLNRIKNTPLKNNLNVTDKVRLLLKLKWQLSMKSQINILSLKVNFILCYCCCQWLFSRQSRDGPHGFCGDALCLVLLTPICLTSVYLCGMGSLSYLQKGAWEGVGLAFLSLIVLFTFFLWGFTTIRSVQLSNRYDSALGMVLHAIFYYFNCFSHCFAFSILAKELECYDYLLIFNPTCYLFNQIKKWVC